MNKISILLLSLSFSISFGIAQNSKPVLRLNTEMHVNDISDLAVDKTGKFILTASEDNTAKLWDLNNGDLIRTFRVPIPNGSSNKLYACAISPNGKFVAVAGYENIDNSCNSIFVFSTHDGKLHQRFGEYLNKVNDLAFSPDGTFLVCSYLREKEVAIYKIDLKTNLFNSFKKLEGSANGCKQVCFDSTGRLLTGSYDNKVRLYDANFRLIKESEMENEIREVVFSSDGSKIVVLYNIVYEIDVLSGIDLRLLYKPKWLESIATAAVFSNDSKTLYVTGILNAKERKYGMAIRKYEDSKKGNYTDIPAGKDLISHLKVIPYNGKNQLVFAGSFELGKIDENNKIAFLKSGEINDFSFGQNFRIRINKTGSIVSFQPESQNRIYYSVKDRKLRVVENETEVFDLKGSNDEYKTNYGTVLSGYNVMRLGNFVDSAERKFITNDFSEDGNNIVFGSVNHIYCSDAKGNLKWQQEIGSKVESIIISDNDSVVVTQQKGGILCWYKTKSDVLYETFRILSIVDGSIAQKNDLRTDDLITKIDGKFFNTRAEVLSYLKEEKRYTFTILRNKEIIEKAISKVGKTFGFIFKAEGEDRLLMTLYTHTNNKDWILFTPDGFFDCAVGSEKLVGWHVNQGFNKEPVFYPLGQFYEQFYTPNLGSRILNGEKFISKVQINQEFCLPPIIEFLSLNKRGDLPYSQKIFEVVESEIHVSVKATDQGGGIDEISLYHNGKLLDGTTRGFKLAGQTQTFTITLTDGENRIKATAFNTQRTEAIPCEIVVNYNAPQQVKPNLYILAIGINSYLNPKYNLNYAKNDAEAFVQSLQLGATPLFGSIGVSFISDADATKAGIVAAFDKIKATAKAEDVFVFYYAGHGVMSAGSEAEKSMFYLVPRDVTKMYEADDMLKSKAISAAQIGELSKFIKAQKQLFVIDACQSGGAMQTLAMRGAAEEKAIAQLARSTGTYFIAASGSEQFATEVAELGHGVFTYAVIEALKGSCNSPDGKVSVNLLKSCVEDLVPELSQKYKGQPQFPTGYGFGMDFPIVLVKK